jgi:hypothetical protein
MFFKPCGRRMRNTVFRISTSDIETDKKPKNCGPAKDGSRGPHKKAVKKIGLEGVKEKQMLLLPVLALSP